MRIAGFAERSKLAMEKLASRSARSVPPPAAVAVMLSIVALVVQVAGSPPPRRLTADFVMERSIAALSDTVRSSGRLSMGGAGLLRWEVTKPSRSIMIVNRDRAWMVYPDMKVTRSFDLASDPVMRVLSDHMLGLTAGDLDAIGEFYRVSDLDGGVRRLKPREEEVRRVFSEIRVSFSAPGIVHRVELVSPEGDTTLLSFSNVVVDPTLDPALFREPRE